MELVTVKNDQIVLAQSIIEAVEEFELIEIDYEMHKAQINLYKDMIFKAMTENGIKKVDIPMSDGRTASITRVADTTTTKKEVDFVGLKEQGLYETFVTEKTSPKRGYVKISIKGTEE